GVKLVRLVDTVRIVLVSVHVDHIECVLALFFVCFRQVATRKQLFDRLTRFLYKVHFVTPICRGAQQRYCDRGVWSIGEANNSGWAYRFPCTPISGPTADVEKCQEPTFGRL